MRKIPWDSFATPWLICLTTPNHGLQPWLRSVAAPRLNKDAAIAATFFVILVSPNSYFGQFRLGVFAKRTGWLRSNREAHLFLLKLLTAPSAPSAQPPRLVKAGNVA